MTVLEVTNHEDVRTIRVVVNKEDQNVQVLEMLDDVVMDINISFNELRFISSLLEK